MLRNKIGPVFNARNGSFFFVFLFFLKNPLLSAGRMRFLKTKKQNKKKLDQFLTLEKAKIGPVFNSTAYIYIYRERACVCNRSIERKSENELERE